MAGRNRLHGAVKEQNLTCGYNHKNKKPAYTTEQKSNHTEWFDRVISLYYDDSTSVKVKTWLRKLVYDIFREGFNEYGNQQITYIRGCLPTNALVGTQQWVLYTAAAAGTVDFGYITMAMIPAGTANPSSDYITCNIQLSPFQAITIGPSNMPTNTKMVWTTGGLARAQNGAGWANDVSYPLSFTDYVGEVTFTSPGQTLILAVLSIGTGTKTVFAYNSSVPPGGVIPPSGTQNVNIVSSVPLSVSGQVDVGTIYTTVNVGGLVDVANVQSIIDPVTVQQILNPVTVTGTVTVSAPITLTGVLDTHIVAIDTLDNAVWVTQVNPNLPVMYPPPVSMIEDDVDVTGSRVLEGSFNPYGNGQYDWGGWLPRSTRDPGFGPELDEIVETTPINVVRCKVNSLDLNRSCYILLSELTSFSERFKSEEFEECIGIEGGRCYVSVALDKAIKDAWADMVKEGSFNPYGNGQPGLTVSSEFARQNPYVEIVANYSFEGFTELLVEACASLPPISADLAKQIVDPRGYPLHEHPLAFKDVDMDGDNNRIRKELRKQASSNTPEIGAKSKHSEKSKVEDRAKMSAGKQLKQVAKRVSERMTSWDNLLVWLTYGDRPPITLAQMVYDTCRRNNLAGSEGVAHNACLLVIQGAKDREILLNITYYCPELLHLRSCEKYIIWEKERFSSGSLPRVSGKSSNPNDISNLQQSEWEVVHDETGEVLEGSFNQYGNGQHEVVAYLIDLTGVVKEGSFNPYGNGQPSLFRFPKDMTDLETGNVSVCSLIEAAGQPSGHTNDVLADVIEQTGLQNIQGITMSSVPREIHIRGGVISDVNVVTPTNTLNSPEALLYPTQQRTPAGVLANNPTRPSTFGVGLVRRKALNPEVMSAMGLVLQELLGRAGNIRPDQITESGFLTSDTAMLTRVGPSENGDSISALLLKSYLYEKSRCWVNDPSQLPLGGEPGKFDSYTQLDNNPVVGVGFNTGAVFNSDCLVGLDFVFPYVNAATIPTIAFHVCKATIPDNEPWFMVRPGLLLQNDSGEFSINMALLAMLLAPYPCGIHTVSITTTDAGGGNLGAQTFIPHSDLVAIPGIESTIHLYLPNKYPAGPPATQAAANAQVLIQPQAGPTAANLIPANGLLNVSFIGNVVRYNLANYLYTWMALPNSPIDLTSLARFRRNVTQLTQRYNDLEFAWEMSCCLTARYPILVSTAPGVVVQFDPGDNGATACQNWFALRPLLMAADYPVQVDSYDHYLPDMNPLWWCKIMSGAYVSKPDGEMISNKAYDGSPRNLQYTIHSAREYAVTSEFIFTYMMQSSLVWNSAFAQLNFVNILAQIRGFFTQAMSPAISDAMISENGEAVAMLHCKVNGNRPADDMFGNTLWDYINAPQVGFQSVYNGADVALTLCTPAVLPDIWVQLNMDPKTLSFTPLLSTNKFLTGVSLPNGQVTPFGAGSYMSPMLISEQPRAIGLDSVPTLNDATLFNARLTWHRFPAQMFDLAGVAVVAGVPAASNVVAQKSVIDDWTMDNLLTPSILTANTRWFPYMDLNGNRLAVGVTAANGATLMTQIMGRRITTGVATWLLKGANAVPNNIVTAGGGNTTSRIPTRRGRLNLSSSSEQDSEYGEGKKA